MRVLLAAGSALALGGCAQLMENRVEDELIQSGIPPRMAECMALRLTDRLDALQLRKLTRLAPEPGEPDIPLTVAGFLERAQRVDDPQVVEVAAGAAAVCAFEGI